MPNYVVLACPPLSGIEHQMHGHVNLTADDFHNNRIISCHWCYHRAAHPTTTLTQALNEEMEKILFRPENCN